MEEGRRQMMEALNELALRLHQWTIEGANLQRQLVNVTAAVFLDNRPPTPEEEEWARKLIEEGR